MPISWYSPASHLEREVNWGKKYCEKHHASFGDCWREMLYTEKYGGERPIYSSFDILLILGLIHLGVSSKPACPSENRPSFPTRFLFWKVSYIQRSWKNNPNIIKNSIVSNILPHLSVFPTPLCMQFFFFGLFENMLQLSCHFTSEYFSMYVLK